MKVLFSLVLIAAVAQLPTPAPEKREQPKLRKIKQAPIVSPNYTM